MQYLFGHCHNTFCLTQTRDTFLQDVLHVINFTRLIYMLFTGSSCNIKKLEHPYNFMKDRNVLFQKRIGYQVMGGQIDQRYEQKPAVLDES